METLYTYTIFIILVSVIALPYWIRAAKKRREASEKHRKDIRSGSLRPVTLHPHIDAASCIGCGSCVRVCPEDVLALAHGTVSIVHGMRCVGHGLCAEMCPVGAIRLGFGTPKEGEEIPFCDASFQTNVHGLYVVGELGGMGLIRNAVAQAKTAVEHIARRRNGRNGADFDVVIVGAGPAGLTGSLGCQEKGLSYVGLEQDSIGGTVFHYPRQKLVLTNPVTLPLYGDVDAREISKEELLTLWQSIIRRHKPNIQTGVTVSEVIREERRFLIKAGDTSWSASNVILALGRRGSPRKLGVLGEDLPKVAYRLIEAESYQDKHILIVGGGDSAVEAAVALARQRGNRVTISYRRSEFVRLKEKNEKNVNDMIRSKKIAGAFSTQVVSIAPDSVTLSRPDGMSETIQNDFVFVFAGGVLPAGLLRKAGVQFRTQDITP